MILSNKPEPSTHHLPMHNEELFNSVTRADRLLLVRVADLANQLHDNAYKIKEKNAKYNLRFECHSICRAFHIHLPELTVVDGNFFGIEKKDDAIYLQLNDHSWLLTPDGAIIDPYPVGFLTIGPMMTVRSGIAANFGGNMYQPNPEVTARICGRVTTRKAVTLAACMVP